MTKKTLIITLSLLGSTLFLSAQSSPLQGVINHYAAVLSYDSCQGRLAVSDTTGFVPGARMLIWHTQGAVVNASNSTAFGSITDVQQTGLFETAIIASKAESELVLERRLLYPVLPNEKVQIVTYPHFESAVVMDTLRPLPWNGSFGGIIAFTVSGDLKLNAPVIADGMGFRGGIPYVAPTNNCTWILPETDYFYANGNWRGGVKGEGIALPLIGKELGRGALANAGGGGNDHNAGGGGGGNFSTGGQGGDNDEPSTFGCDGYYPGIGGRSLSTSNSRIFLGGGGGAGHSNNTITGKGGNGGGIILIKSGSISGTFRFFSANGTNGGLSAGDGGGGGGAAGTIILDCENIPIDFTYTLTGGNGGNATGGNGPRCFGPGGGGSGGLLIIPNQLSAYTPAIPTGGANGVVTLSTNGCNGSGNNAAPGGPGTVLKYNADLLEILMGNHPAGLPEIIVQPQAVTACSGDFISLESGLNLPDFPVQWQILENGTWTDIPGANNLIYDLTAAAISQSYRMIVDGGACYSLTTDPAIISVPPPPDAQFTYLAVNDQTIQFSNISLNSTGYFWDFGDGSSSNEENPMHTFSNSGIFEVVLTAWNACDTLTNTQEISILSAPVAAFEVPDTISSCNTAVIQMANFSGNATTWQWYFPGGNPIFATLQNPEVTYMNPGSYTATLIAGNGVLMDTIAHTFYVAIVPFPAANFNAVDQPGGTSVQFQFTGSNAIFFTWEFGDGSPSSNSPAPLHQFPAAGTYTIRLTVQNECGASVLEQTIEVKDENVGILEAAHQAGVQIWPNPGTDGFWIKSETAFTTNIYTEAGALMKAQALPARSAIYIDATDWPAGVYRIAIGALSTPWIKQ